MFIFFRKFSVYPNQTGFLYRKNRLYKKLEPGIYRFFSFFSVFKLYNLPNTSRLLNVINQEILTKDNIAFRFSYFIKYKIEDGNLLLSSFDLEKGVGDVLRNADEHLHKITQLKIRSSISALNSEELNEKRNEISDFLSDDIVGECRKSGILLQEVSLRDITFPKSIQDLFSKQLEAKIRAKADLENARTNVAAARALKNASEIMKGDENIKFFHFLETITKIAAKGNHNFYIGDFVNNNAMTLRENQGPRK